MRILFALASLALASVCFGCGDDDDGTNSTSNGTSFTASVSGAKAQSAANAYVLWTADSGQGDQIYRLGSGTSSGGKASVSLSVSKGMSGQAILPDGALLFEPGSSFKLGVGLIALTEPSVSLPEGTLSEEQGDALETQIVGLSTRYALIYRDGEPGPDDGVAWIDRFPQGLSCGRCVTTPKNPDGTSNGFDTFEPVDCGSLEVETGDLKSLDLCNWT